MIARLLNLVVSKNRRKLIWYLMNHEGKKFSYTTKLPFPDYFFVAGRQLATVESAYPELKYYIEKMPSNHHFSEYADRDEAVYKVNLPAPDLKDGMRKRMELEFGELIYEADITYTDLVLKDLDISEFVAEVYTEKGDGIFELEPELVEEVYKQHPDFAPIKTAFFDFETDDREASIKASNYSSFAKPDTCRLLSCSILDLETGDIKHFCREDEFMLLAEIKLEFMKYHHLSAWNFKGFDYYFSRRWKEHGISFNWNQWITTDAMNIHEILNPKERKFVSLDKAGERYVDTRKIKHDEGFYEMFERAIEGEIMEGGDMPLLEYYNNTDVEIMYKLEQKFGFTGIALNLCHHPEVGILPQTFRFHRKPSIQAILRASLDHYGKRIIWKSKSEIPLERSYVGAMTLDSVAGRHDNVIGIDLASLYNNVVQTWNISPEQIVLENEGYYTAVDKPKHHAYNRFPHEGIMPKVLRIFEAGRNEYKKLRVGATGEQYETYEQIQQGLKIVLLSITGGMGARGSTAHKAGEKPSGAKSFYNWYCASDFTAFSRKILEIAIVVAQDRFKLQVVYGDTDGIYLSLEGFKLTIGTIQDLLHDLTNAINDEARTLLEEWDIPKERQKIVMEAQGWYHPFVLFGKKKHHFSRMVYNAESEEEFSDDVVEIYAKGVRMAQTSAPEFIKTFQKAVYTKVLEYKSRAEIEDYIAHMFNNFIDGKYDDSLVFERKLKHTSKYKVESPHVRLAKTLIAAGRLQEESTIFYVLAHTDMKGRAVAKLDGFPISRSGRSYFWNNHVKSWLTEVLEVVYPLQTGLDQFEDWCE